MLPDTKIRDYIESGGGECPYCGSGDISGEGFEVGSGTAWQPCTCQVCWKSWNDVYTLTGIS